MTEAKTGVEKQTPITDIKKPLPPIVRAFLDRYPGSAHEVHNEALLPHYQAPLVRTLSIRNTPRNPIVPETDQYHNGLEGFLYGATPDEALTVLTNWGKWLLKSTRPFNEDQWGYTHRVIETLSGRRFHDDVVLFLDEALGDLVSSSRANLWATARDFRAETHRLVDEAIEKHGNLVRYTTEGFSAKVPYVAVTTPKTNYPVERLHDWDRVAFAVAANLTSVGFPDMRVYFDNRADFRTGVTYHCVSPIPTVQSTVPLIAFR